VIHRDARLIDANRSADRNATPATIDGAIGDFEATPATIDGAIGDYVPHATSG
jgi:hypothetical protein